MSDDHCPAMPQVAVVDEQFGTHTARVTGASALMRCSAVS